MTDAVGRHLRFRLWRNDAPPPPSWATRAIGELADIDQAVYRIARARRRTR